ncbi:MAG: hypothetical protein IJ784_09245 [Ruminiclostridium sp.]|nr:hypothetical protein [Ruminiclostridium sp.]
MEKKYEWTAKKVVLGIVGGLAIVGLLFGSIALIRLIIDAINNPPEDKSKLNGVFGGGATGLVEYVDEVKYNGSGNYYRYLVEFHDDGTAIWWQNNTYYSGEYKYNQENDNYTLTVQGSGFVLSTVFIINKTEYTTIKNRHNSLDDSFWSEKLNVNAGSDIESFANSFYNSLVLDSVYGYGTDTLYHKKEKTFVYKEDAGVSYNGKALNVNGGVFNNSLFEELTNYNNITSVVNDLNNDIILHEPFITEK